MVVPTTGTDTPAHRGSLSAGFASGACAATLYCLHCPEVSALFILTWYTLGRNVQDRG